MGILQWYRLNIEEVWKGLALTILVLVTVFVLTTWYRTWSSFEQDMADRVVVANHYAQTFLGRSQRQIASLAAHPDMVAMQPETMQTLMDNLLLLGSDFSYIVAYDVNGDYVAGFSEAGPLPLQVQRKIASIDILMLVETPSLCPPGLAIYAPIRNTEGWIVGVVRGLLEDITLASGLRMAQQVGVPSIVFYDGGSLLMMDGSNIELVYSGALVTLEGRILAKGHNVQRYTLVTNNEASLFFFQKLPAGNGYVGTIVPRSVFWEMLFRNTLAESINIILVSLLFAVIAWQTGRNIRLRFLNENIIRFQAMESLTTMGQMAAGMVHEVKNPLTVIDGYLQLWDNYPEKYTAEKTLDTIRGELDRIMMVLNEYLALSRGNGANMGRVRINDLLRSVITLMDVYTYRKGITIHTHFTNVPEVAGDSDKLRQVFVNLIKNAVEAMDSQGGNIYVHVKRESDDKIIVVISDDGPGMHPQDVEKLGHPFFTTKATGTGLGIPVSFRIIQEHGGRVIVESKSGKGTTFKVFLPINS